MHKLFLRPPKRYSEDIDFVQIQPGPIGPVFDAIRGILDPFLNEPRRKQGPGVMTMTFRVESDGPPVLPIRIKVEINSREHFTVFGHQRQPFAVQSRWFSGDCQVTSFFLEELLGSKLRALFQRRKGRDLFDLWVGLREGKASPDKVLYAFQRFLRSDGLQISRDAFLQNLDEKLRNPVFLTDIRNLVPRDVVFDAESAAVLVREQLLTRLKS